MCVCWQALLLCICCHACIRWFANRFAVDKKGGIERWIDDRLLESVLHSHPARLRHATTSTAWQRWHHQSQGISLVFKYEIAKYWNSWPVCYAEEKIFLLLSRSFQRCKSGRAGFGLKFVKIFRAYMQNFFATMDTFVATYCWGNRVDQIFNK